MAALSVEEAQDRVLGSVEPLAPLELPLQEAHGCVLAAEIVADGDVPPVDVAAADGFAVRAADIHGAGRETPVDLTQIGWSRPGRPAESAVAWGQTVRVSAGAPMPGGADAVVPLGDALVQGETVRVAARAELGERVAPAGAELRAGQPLVPAGRRLAAPEIALLASAGRSSALAYPRVRVAVIPVGDLAEPGQPAAAGQAWDAVSHALAGALLEAGAVPYRVGVVRGGEEHVRAALSSNLVRADAFVCAGDVLAAGGHDLVTSGLGSVDALPVAMEPGGSLDVGTLEGKAYFGLAADPVAALVAFEVLIRPAVLRMMGRRAIARPEVEAAWGGDPARAGDATRYLAVRVNRSDGRWRAEPAGTSLAALVDANGLGVLPAGSGIEQDGLLQVRLMRAPAG